jgi:hypothetical protein
MSQNAASDGSDKQKRARGLRVLENIMTATTDDRKREEFSSSDSVSTPIPQTTQSYLPVPPKDSLQAKKGRGEYRRQQRVLSSAGKFEKPKRRVSKSVNMAKFFYAENKSKAKAQTERNEKLFALCFSKSPSERIGENYSRTLLSPRTLRVFELVATGKGKRKLWAKLKRNTKFPISTSKTLSAGQQKILLSSLRSVEDVLWRDYIAPAPGSKVKHIPTGRLCLVEEYRTQRPRVVLNPIAPNGNTKKLQNIETGSTHLLYAHPIDIMATMESQSHAQVFKAISKSVRNLRASAEQNRRLELIKKDLVQYLDSTGESIIYPFLKYKQNCEIESLGKNAILEGNVLFQVARRKMMSELRQKTRAPQPRTDCGVKTRMGICAARRLFLLENHLYGTRGVPKIVLELIANFPQKNPLSMSDDNLRDGATMNGKRYVSCALSRMNLVVNRINAEWRKTIIVRVKNIIERDYRAELSLDSETAYSNSFSRRLIRRVELQMEHVIRGFVKKWVSQWTTQLLNFQKEYRPYFEVKVISNAKSLETVLKPSIETMCSAFMQIPKLSNIVRDQLLRIRGSILVYFPNDTAALYDPNKEPNINLEANRIAMTFCKVERSMRNAKQSFVFSANDFSGTYDELNMLGRKVQTMNTCTYIENLVLFDISQAKVSIVEAVANTVQEKLEQETKKLEKLLTSTISNLGSVKLLIDRIPATPEEWREQIELYRERDQFAERIGTDVQKVVTCRLDFLESKFLKLTRNVLPKAWEVQLINTYIFQKGDEMVLVLHKAAKKFKSILNGEENAFLKALTALQEALDAFEEESKLDNAIECLQTIESLQNKVIEILLEKKRLVNVREVLEVKDARDIPGHEHSETLKTKINILFNLWTAANEWAFFKENWFHGIFGTIDIEEMRTKLDTWGSCLSEAIDSDLKASSRNTANRLRLQLHSFSKHIPIITMLRHPGMRQRHWKELGFRPKTFQHALDKNIDVKRLENIHFIADEEYKLEMEVSGMIKSWNSRPVFRTDGLGIVQHGIKKDLFRVSILLQSPYASPHELKFLEWQSDLEELNELVCEWKMGLVKWDRLGFLLNESPFQEMCKKAYGMLETVSNNLSSLLSAVTEKPFLSNNNAEHLKQLQKLNIMLSAVESLTAVYVNAKRDEIPRLHFLSDTQVFEILKRNMSVFSNVFGNGTLSSCSETCFVGRNGKELLLQRDSKNAVGSLAHESEAIITLEKAMQTAVKRSIFTQYFSLEMQSSKGNLPSLHENHIKSITLAKSVYSAHWTKQIEAAFALLDTRHVLEALKKVHYVICSTIKNVAQNQGPSMSSRMESDILLIYLSTRDDTAYLIKNLVRSKDNFIWHSTPKLYATKLSDQTASLKTCVLNHMIDHHNEFIGDYSRLVMTPKTTKCLQAIIRCTVGASKGGLMTGDVHTAENLLYECACSFGKVFVPISFSEFINSTTLEHFFKGIVMLGAWGALINTQNCSAAIASLTMTVLREVQSFYHSSAEDIRPSSTETIKLYKPVFFQVKPPVRSKDFCFEEGYAPLNTVLPEYEIVSELLMVSYGFTNASVIAPKLISCLVPFGMSSLAPKIIRLCASKINSKYREINISSEGDNIVDEGEYMARIIHFLVPHSKSFISEYFGDLGLLHRSKYISHKSPFAHIIKQSVAKLGSLVGIDRSLIVTGPARSGKSKTIKAASKGKTVIPVYMQSYDMPYLDSASSCYDPIYHEIKMSCDSLSVLPVWIVFDGALTGHFIDFISLAVKNFPRRIQFSKIRDAATLPKRSELVFETVNIDHVSPSFINSCTILHIRSAELDWDLLLQNKFSTAKKMVRRMILDCLDLCPTLSKGTIIQTAASMMGIIRALQTKAARGPGKSIPSAVTFFSVVWSFNILLRSRGVESAKIENCMRSHLSVMGISLSSTCTIFECIVDIETEQLVPVKVNVAHYRSLEQLRSVSSMLMSQSIPVAFVGDHRTKAIPSKILNAITNQQLVHVSIPRESGDDSNSMFMPKFHSQVSNYIEQANTSRFRPANNGDPVLIHIDDLNFQSASNVVSLEMFRMHEDFEGWWFPDNKWYNVDKINWLISCDNVLLEENMSSPRKSSMCPQVEWGRILSHCAILSYEREDAEIDAVCSVFCANLVHSNPVSRLDGEKTENKKIFSEEFFGKIVQASRFFHVKIQNAFRTMFFDTRIFECATRHLAVANKDLTLSSEQFLSLWKNELNAKYCSYFTESRHVRSITKIFASCVREATSSATGDEWSKVTSKSQKWYLNEFSNELKCWEKGEVLTKVISASPELFDSVFCVHESFEYDIIRVCKTLREKNAVLVLTGPCRCELRNMMLVSANLLEYGIIFSSWENIMGGKMKLENTIFVLPITTSWMQNESVPNGPSIWDMLTEKIRHFPSSTKMVFMIDSVDRHGDSEWIRNNKKNASVIHSAISSKLSVLDRQDDVAFQNEHVDVIPAFLSLYYQASSTWKSTLGLPCVPQQFRRAVSLFKRLHEFHNGKIQLMKRRTSRLDAAASNLNDKFDNVCRKIKTAQDSLVGIGATVSATGAAIDECDSSMGDLAIKAKVYEEKMLAVQQQIESLTKKFKHTYTVVYDAVFKTSNLVKMKLTDEIVTKRLNLKRQKGTKKTVVGQLLKSYKLLFGKKTSGKQVFSSIGRCIELQQKVVARRQTFEEFASNYPANFKVEDAIKISLKLTKLLEKGQVQACEDDALTILCDWLHAVVSIFIEHETFKVEIEPFRENNMKCEKERKQINRKIYAIKQSKQQLQKTLGNAQSKHAEYEDIVLKYEDIQTSLENLRNQFLPHVTAYRNHTDIAEDAMKTMKGDIILSAAFVSFCGPMASELRQKCWKDWKVKLRDLGIICSDALKGKESDGKTEITNDDARETDNCINRLTILGRTFSARTDDFEMFPVAHFRENKLIIEHNNTNDAIIIDPDGHYRAWAYYGEVAQNNSEKSLSAYDCLPKLQTSTWYTKTLVSVDQAHEHYFVERLLCMIMELYDTDRDATLSVLKLVPQKTFDAEEKMAQAIDTTAQRITELNNNLAEAYAIQKLHQCLSQKEQEYDIFFKEQEEEVSLLRCTISKSRENWYNVAHFLYFLYMGIKSMAYIAPVESVSFSSFLNVAKLTLSQASALSADMTHVKKIKCVAAGITCLFFSRISKHHRSSFLLALWKQTRLHLCAIGAGPEVVGTEWEALSMAHEKSGQDPIFGTQVSSRKLTVQEKNQKQKIQKDVPDHIAKWCTSSTWQKLVQLCRSVSSFQPLLDGLANPLATTISSSLSNWHGNCTKYISDACIGSIGPDKLGEKLWAEQLPGIENSPLKKLVFFKFVFPQVLPHCLSIFFQKDQIFGGVMQALKARQKLVRTEHVESFLNLPGNPVHLLVANDPSIETMGLIHHTAIGMGHSNLKNIIIKTFAEKLDLKQCKSMAQSGGWLLVLRPDVGTKKTTLDVLKCISDTLSSQKQHPDFRCIIVLDRHLGTGHLSQAFVERLPCLLVNKISTVHGSIIEHMYHEDWSSLPESLRSAYFFASRVYGALASELEGQKVFNGDSLTVGDNHFKLFWGILTQPDIIQQIVDCSGSQPRVAEQRVAASDKLDQHSTLEMNTLSVVEKFVLSVLMVALRTETFTDGERMQTTRTLKRICRVVSTNSDKKTDTSRNQHMAQSAMSVKNYASKLLSLNMVGANDLAVSGVTTTLFSLEVCQHLQQTNNPVKNFGSSDLKKSKTAPYAGRFKKYLNDLLSLNIKAQNLLQNMSIAPSISAVELVALQSERTSHQSIAKQIWNDLIMCIAEVDKPFEDSFKGMSAYMESKFRHGTFENVYSALYCDAVPHSWNRIMKENSPMAWMKRFNVRARYHTAWATAGRTMGLALPMYSEPLYTLFMIKYKFACQYQLPISDVVLVTENTFVAYGEKMQLKNKSFSGVFEGLFCMGADITSRGECKLMGPDRGFQISAVPSTRLYAVDRQSFKPPPEAIFCPVQSWRGRVLPPSKSLGNETERLSPAFVATGTNGIYLGPLIEEKWHTEIQVKTKLDQISILYLLSD